MAALEFEQEVEEEEDEHDQLLDATNGNGNGNGHSRRPFSSPNKLLPLSSSRAIDATSSSSHEHHNSYHHRRQRQRQRRFVIILCIATSAVVFIAAARFRYNNNSNTSSDNNNSSSIATTWSTSSSSTNAPNINIIDNNISNSTRYSHNHPLPPAPPLPLFNQSFATFLTTGLTKILSSNNGTTKHYIYNSPYEVRYPTSQQPYWARKTIPYNKKILETQQICLVHVGKAGGSTLGCMLGFSLHCDENSAAAAAGSTAGSAAGRSAAGGSATSDTNDEDENDRVGDDHDEDDGGGGDAEDEEDMAEDINNSNNNDNKKNNNKQQPTTKKLLQIKGLLPIATTHVFHRGVNDCADVAAYYLFVVRDPLARILSAYNYERPDMTKPIQNRYKNQFMGKEIYEECNFWTLEQLAQNGLLNTKKDERSLNCQRRAYDAITGVGGYLCHGYFNYQYYAQTVFGVHDDNDKDAVQDNGGGSSVIPDNANLIVIRNDHIVDDWNTINLMIGGFPEDAIQSEDIPMNNAHAKNATEMYLSDESKIILCQVLCNEIQVYKDILRRAINFQYVDVTTSLEELRQSCPKEAVEESCSMERPNFHDRIERAHGEL